MKSGWPSRRACRLVGVNHLEGHLLALPISATVANDARHRCRTFALLVSGGHTALLLVRALETTSCWAVPAMTRRKRPSTKSASCWALAIPPAHRLTDWQRRGMRRQYDFPKAMTGQKRGLQLSFSGLKTAAAAYLAANPHSRG